MTDTDVIDDVIDAIDELSEQVENVVEVTRNNPWLFIGGFAIGATVGGILVYRYTVKKMSLYYEERMTEEIEQAREFYKRLDKTEEFETPEKALEHLVPGAVTEAVKEYQGHTAYNQPVEVVVTPPAADPRPPIENVFANRDPRDWDWELEVKRRADNPGKPYVITREEFEDNPDHHEQITLTYFAGDQILSDEADQTVEDTDRVVGEENLKRFGAGSEDNKVVYIRNEKISADYEVLYSDGWYQVEVLGGEPELKHSDFRHGNRMRVGDRPRRMRERDDG